MSDPDSWPLCGHLRILAPPACGRRIVAPLLNGFEARYPAIALELLLSDRPADFSADHIDILFSHDRIVQQGIAALLLLPVPMVSCASSAYAQAHGLPQQVGDLANHRCIVFRSPRGQIQEWEFRINGFRQRFVPFARHTFNDADLIVRAVCAGLGIAQLPAYQVDDLLAEGKLVRCLTQYAPEDGALYLCHPYRQKAAARLFAVYVSEAARIGAQKSTV